MLLWIFIALTLAMIATAGAVIATGLDPDTASDNAPVFAVAIIMLTWALSFLACVVTGGMWIHRAHANLFAAGLEGLQFTPGWSVGWFFVPIAFLFKPLEAMVELWNASQLKPEGYKAPTGRLLPVWWGFWVVGNGILNVSARIGGAESTLNMFDVLGYGLLAAAAWCLLRIVKTVTQAQVSQLSAAHAFA